MVTRGFGYILRLCGTVLGHSRGMCVVTARPDRQGPPLPGVTPITAIPVLLMNGAHGRFPMTLVCTHHINGAMTPTSPLLAPIIGIAVPATTAISTRTDVNTLASQRDDGRSGATLLQIKSRPPSRRHTTIVDTRSWRIQDEHSGIRCRRLTL
jgi:hypothetical protein